MRVGVVTAYDEPIGFNYGVLNFCRLAPSHDVETTLIAMTRHPHRSNRMIAEAERVGLQIENLHERYRYDPRVFSDLVGLIDKLDLDLIDAQTYKPLMLGLYARHQRHRVGLVSWVHGFTKENFKIQLFGMVERYLHRFADRTVCVSGPFSEMLVARGLERDKIVVVPNAIEEEPITGRERADIRAELGLSPDERVVGAIGRLSPEKGHTFLLKAWPDIFRSLPTARLVLVGDGPCMEALRREASHLGIEKSVLFTGFRPDGKRLFSLFDIMALPSLEEGLPYVLLESMISKVPVVASRVGEVPEVLQDGKLGRLVDPKDASGLARAILGLLNNHEEALQLAKDAYSSVRTRYSQEARTRQIVEVYEDVLRHRSQR